MENPYGGYNHSPWLDEGYNLKKTSGHIWMKLKILRNILELTLTGTAQNYHNTMLKT